LKAPKSPKGDFNWPFRQSGYFLIIIFIFSIAIEKINIIKNNFTLLPAGLKKENY
jgi:hypothetical protein